MSRISDLLLRKGDIEAQRASNSGRGWASAIEAGAGFMGGLQQRNQADADRATKQRVIDSQLKSDSLQQANLQGQIDERAAGAQADEQTRALAQRTMKVNEWLTSIAGTQDPEQAKAIYADGVQRLSSDGTLEPGDAPPMFPGMSWVKSRMTMLLPAAERFKQLFPEQKPVGTREVKVRNADGSESIQIVEDKPGQSFDSSPDPDIAAKRKLEADKFAEDQRHNRAVESRAGGSPDTEWVVRNGQAAQIRKGTAQPGDTPYDATAARQGAQSGANGPTPYATERAARTVQAVDELMGKVSGWNTGYGSMFSRLPESDAREFASQLNTLKSNIAFNELAQMREASKTGGALGAVSEREMALLESTLGALDTGQSPAAFTGQLQKIKDSIQRWQAANGGAKPAPAPGPNDTAAPAPPGRPGVVAVGAVVMHQGKRYRVKAIVNGQAEVEPVQ